MKLILAIVVIAAISIIGTRLSFLDRRLSMGVRNILLAGTEYIFLGVLLGPMVLDLLDATTQAQLEPLLLFSLGWVGFIVGLQFEVKQLRSLPRFYFTITLIQAFVAFGLVAAATWLVLTFATEIGAPTVLATSLALGSAAACTSPSALAIVTRSYKFKNLGVVSLLRYIAGVDGLFALIFFAAALSLVPLASPQAVPIYRPLVQILVTAAAGLFPAVILVALNRTRFSHQEFLLFLFGTVMFCAGLAASFGAAPLLSGLVCGVVTANFCRHRARALQIVVQAERSLYIILLLLIGAAWQLKIDVGLVLVIAYFAVRLAGKLAGAFAATRAFRPRYPCSPWVGLGLVPEGGLAIAMIISFVLTTGWPVSQTLITVIVLSVLVSDLVGPRLILALFDIEDRSHG